MTWWTPERKRRHNELYEVFIKEMFLGEQRCAEPDKRYSGLTSRYGAIKRFRERMAEQKKIDGD